jgi:hypothetical protein
MRGSAASTIGKLVSKSIETLQGIAFDSTRTYDVLSYLDTWLVRPRATRLYAKAKPDELQLPSWVPDWSRDIGSLTDGYLGIPAKRTILSTLEVENETQKRIRQQIVTASHAWSKDGLSKAENFITHRSSIVDGKRLAKYSDLVGSPALALLPAGAEFNNIILERGMGTIRCSRDFMRFIFVLQRTDFCGI